MRKLYCYMILPLMVLVSGCQHEEFMPAEQDGDVMEVYATIEDIDDGQTRTYLSGTDVFWSSGDKIAVFYKNTLRKRFDVTPESIDSKNATFLLDEGYVQMGSNVNVSHNVSYYPFCEVTCAPDGSSYTLSNLTLPSIQSYVDGSVGLGAFPMVAVTENTDDVNFCFKNICGVMQFQLKGSGFVKSVSVRGNRGEVLAGSAVVTAGYSKEPSISMSTEGVKEVTLDCGESGVELNETTPVSFFIVLPPVGFEGGFTITVTDTWGGHKEYSTTKKNPVGRSKGLRMPAKEYIGVRPPQEGDYIDEYGVNHGQGIEIDGVVWAPVNCGYHEADFKYGKMYQWGRKYGQGYEGELWDDEVKTDQVYSDALIPEVVKGLAYLKEYQSSDNANIYFDVPALLNPKSFPHWRSTLWNQGTEEYPIKSEYDPCPDGWRVPTLNELTAMVSNVVWGQNDGLYGSWIGGSASNSSAEKFFLPAAGLTDYSYFPSGRGNCGCYWLSLSSEKDLFNMLLFDSVDYTLDSWPSNKAPAAAVRCVKDDTEVIPVESISINKTELTLFVGTTETLSASFLPANANQKEVYWYSKDNWVATVDASGKIEAQGIGTVTITAMAGMQTAECVVTVVEETYFDLSLSGTANSYIVSQNGSYKFKTVKGNSSESVGAVASAEVLWESFGTDVTPNVGDLVKNVSYNNGEITFDTADTFKEGNAVIAAKDASGNIIWSWHIWLTDEPQGQEYYNNAGTMMDRNLGATSATPGDVGALGLLYQWGRKDPFLGSSSIRSEIEAKSTGTWPSAISSNSTNGTIEYATAYPTTFIKSNESNRDWYYTGSSTTDNTRWTTSTTTKSIYDPCPSGWRVPDGGSNGIWSKAGFDDTTYNFINEGISFSISSSSTTWYPASGCRDGSVGDLRIVAYHGRCWSASPDGYCAFRLNFSYDGSVNPSSSSSRVDGQSVRCVKEGSQTSGGSQTPDVGQEKPLASSASDLGTDGTANSYIVSKSGTYKFKPVKGNSSTSVGSVASVEVLWESFGTSTAPETGDLIKSVNYDSGYVVFATSSSFKEGNAVIAAKDASGTILWSWHIWLTDQPQGQEYYNNAGTMMDRNLGATSATPGDFGALGLLYQWGRKDPFLGSSSISSNIEAKSTGTWPSAVSSNSTKGTIEYATAYPTTFIKYNSSNNDWYYTGSSSTDNTRWTTSNSAKSIYDPCPAGWRIPGSNGIWSKALGSSSEFTQSSLYDSTNEGMNFSGKFGSDQTIWYPASGYRSSNFGSFSGVRLSGRYWSASPNSDHACYLFFSNSGCVNPWNSSTRAAGLSVRCLQE